MRTLIKSFEQFLIILLLALCGNAFATSWPPPTDEDVYSPDRRFVLHITAKTGLHSIADAKAPTNSLWTFQREVWHHTYYVASNGNHVAWISWVYVRTNDFDLPAITIYSKSEGPRSLTFREAGGARRYQEDEIGPVGKFWRIWREKIERDGDWVTIVLPNDKKIRIDLSAGKIEYHR